MAFAVDETDYTLYSRWMQSSLLNRTAIIALLVRHTSAWQEKTQQQNVRSYADAKILEADAIIANCHAGLRAFGIEVNTPGVWEQLSKEYWPEVSRALEPPAQSLAEIARLDESAQDDVASVDRAVEAASLPDEATAPPKMPKLAKIVLERARLAGETGTTAKAIRTFIEETYRADIHWKSVGMTLNRLKQKGLVRADGHTWFFVPPPAETRNPGVGAPGLEEMFK